MSNLYIVRAKTAEVDIRTWFHIPVTSTKVDVANWLQQVESKFIFQSIPQFGKLSIGALKKKNEKTEKEKKEGKDNQYKLKEAMAIAIGLNTSLSYIQSYCDDYLFNVKQHI